MEKGTIEYLTVDSEVLKGNPWGDPSTRRFPVYLPPGYNKDDGKTYPVIFGLTGFTGFGDMYLNVGFLKQPHNEILDEIINKGCPPCIYVMPNCITKLGGSQYVNSPANGRYEDYVIQELVPEVDREFATNGKRAVMGGSSGGIGAFTLAARNPDVFHAFADHSGDSAFELCYLHEVPNFNKIFKRDYDCSFKKYLEALDDPSVEKGNDFHCVMNLIAMSACYCPNSDSEFGFDLPFDTYTAALKTEVWEKMKSHDPVVLVEKLKDNLKKLKGIWIDCGTKDQFHLHFGARQVVEQLKKFDVAHHYEEYNSDHGLLRREQKKKSIPFLLKALT